MELLAGPIVSNEVIETMATARASRYLKADPIPDELLEHPLRGNSRVQSEQLATVGTSWSSAIRGNALASRMFSKRTPTSWRRGSTRPDPSTDGW